MIFFLISFTSSAEILDELHLNIQTTDSEGNILAGTYNFVFNITTDSNCLNVIYSDSETLTTDSRGIISYYLQNTNLNYDQQYYLCYYRNGSLINSTKISRTPYSFRSKYVNSSGIEIDSSLNFGTYNLSAFYFLGSGRYLTDINTSAINLSQINYWELNGGNLFFTSGNVGIGTNSPQRLLHVAGDILSNGTINATGDICIEGGNCLSGVLTSETDPLWTSNYSNYLSLFSWNKTYADSLYYSINNPYGYYNSTTLPVGSYDDAWINDTFYNKTQSDDRYLQSYTEIDPLWASNFTAYNESWSSTYNLTYHQYNSSGLIKDWNSTGLIINWSDSFLDTDKLDGYDSSFFMPLNNSVFGQFDFNGGWTSNGLSIIGGAIYAQTGYFYTLNSISVNNLQINGSLVPEIGYHNQFDLGNSSLRWRDLYLGRNAYVGNNLGVSGSINSTGDICIEGGNCLSGVLTSETDSLAYNGSLYLTSNPFGYYNSTTLPVGNYEDAWINDTFYNKTQSDDRYLQSYTETDPFWSGNFSLYNSSWSSTYNSTYHQYNSSGLIKDWNSTGLIANWSIDTSSFLTSESDPLAYNGTLAFNSSLANYYPLVNPYGFYNSSTIPTYLSGAGTSMRIPLWNGTSSLNNSEIYQGASGNIGIGGAPSHKLDVIAGSVNIPDGYSYMQGGIPILRTSNSYTNTFGGAAAGNESSFEQTAFGYYSGSSNKASWQSAFGISSGRYNLGDYQSAFGYGAGLSNEGDNQVAFGYYSGAYNLGSKTISIGDEALYSNSGNNVIALGYQAGYGNTASNVFILHQANVNSIPLIYGQFDNARVGINHNKPSKTLHVNGTFEVTSTSTLSGNVTVDNCIIFSSGGSICSA